MPLGFVKVFSSCYPLFLIVRLFQRGFTFFYLLNIIVPNVKLTLKQDSKQALIVPNVTFGNDVEKVLYFK